MEDKTVIIMTEVPPQQGQPFKWGIMLDGKSTKLISWEKQDLEVGKAYSITLLDEDAKDVQYDQRRMKKGGNVESLGTEVQGTLEIDEEKDIRKDPPEEEEVGEDLVEESGTFIKGDVKPRKEETKKELPTDDFDDAFSRMIEDMDNDKANDKPPKLGTQYPVLKSTSFSGSKGSQAGGSQLAITNYQRSTLPTNPNKLELNIESIKILNPLATEQNAMKFLQKCIWQNLNPFIGDCYLITYNNTSTGKQDMSMVVSKDVFLKRSANNPNYEGFEAGIIVRIGKELKLDHREGSVYIKGEEELIGGWAKVYIKGLRPINAEVLVAEYHSGKALWKTKTATMIRKVALSQAMREAHPVELQGFYDASEMEIESKGSQ